MNLKDFYSSEQALEILELKFRQQLHRLIRRQGFMHMHVCNKPFYLKKPIHDYIEGKLRRSGRFADRLRYETTKIKLISYDLDLDDWLPRCLALELFGYSYELLYKISDIRTSMPMIETRQAFNIHWFNRQDVEKLAHEIKKNPNVLEGIQLEIS